MTFEEIFEKSDIDDHGIQLMLREVDFDEMVIALYGSSETVRKHIYRNLSRRRMWDMEEDVEALENLPKRTRDSAEMKARIAEMKTRIATITEGLRDSGELSLKEVRP